MRKLFFTAMLFAMVCVLAPRAQSQVTVTGNLKNLGHANVTGSNTFVRFRLNGYGVFLPMVDGSNVIVSDSHDFKPDVFGNINGPLIPNDLIKPRGTFYQACVYFQGIQFRCSTYPVNSAPSTFNINTAPSLTTVPAAGPNQLVMQTFPCVISVAATTWTCTHNFNDSPVIVNAFDANGQQIFPDTVNVSNLNVATLTFVTAQTGTALISHAGAITLATNQPNAVLQNPTGGQTIQGPSLSVSAPTAFTEPVSPKTLANVNYANGFAGADCGAKINAADVALGSSPGEIYVSPLGCGNAWTTPVSLSAGHYLRLQNGFYTTSATVTVGANAGISCVSMGLEFSTLGTSASFCTIQAANGSNLPAVVLLNGASSYLQDIVIDGNKANNPTGGVAINANAAQFFKLRSVSAMNAPTHGLWVNSIGSGAGGGDGCCFTVDLGSIFSGNGIDGIFVTKSADNSDQAAHENNGSTFTVSTTPSSMTATSGAWSTDSSLVNTYVSISTTPPTLCQVTAVGSTTTATLANCVPALGVNAGVTASWGNGFEAHDSPTNRLLNCDLGGNANDGFLAHGTSTGLGLFENQIIGCNLGNQRHHDIEFISADPGTGTVVGWGQIVTGNVFSGGAAKTPDAVWDNIKCQDCYQSSFTGNFYSSGPSPFRAKCAVEITETAMNRSFPSVINGTLLTAPKSFSASLPFGGTCDTAAQGDWYQQGNRFYTSSTTGVGAAVQILDTATGASMYVRGNNGGLDFLNNAFNKILFAIGSGGGISIAGATSGAGILTAPNTGGVASILPSVAGVLTVTIARGTATLGTTLIGSGACASVVTTSAIGVLTTDTVKWSPNADPTGLTGYAPTATGSLKIWAYPSADNVNFKVCNDTSAGITPSALALNFEVTR